MFDEAAANKEKLMGQFSLKFNQALPIAKKIEKYAQDSVVFHLHKNRNFIKKIERQPLEEAAKRDRAERDRRLIEENSQMLEGAAGGRRNRYGRDKGSLSKSKRKP